MNPFSTYHIGLDDTDSSDGMCTTFLAYKIVQKLKDKSDSRLVDYPNLIRLNPSIPWKTRGNGALVIRLESKLSSKQLFGICQSLLKKFATSERANAGLIIFEGEDVPREITDFSRLALFSVQSLLLARNIVERNNLLSFYLRNGQGLVGALAGIGNNLAGDHTFELIAYRKNCKIPRKVNESKVRDMDAATRPSTFNCYDRVNERVLIYPHGPDPVLLGIRGESPSAVRGAFKLLRPLDNLLGFMIFRTNQGTGEHIQNSLNLERIKAYTCGRIRGQVTSTPNIVKGGHVYFHLENDEGSIECAAYEPTGSFRRPVLSLLPGDVIEVAGSVRPASKTHPTIFNLEYLQPLRLVEQISEIKTDPASIKENSISGETLNAGRIHSHKHWCVVRRSLTVGKIYLPDLKAHRHLTKPLQRYQQMKELGLENKAPRDFIRAYA